MERPTSAADPRAYDPRELERAARRTVDLLVQIYKGLEARRVDPGVSPEKMRALFSGTIADQGIGLEAAVEELEHEVLPYCMGTPHPMYLGLVNSSPLPGAVLGDMFVSALNNNNGAFHQSPAMSAAEDEVVEVFRRLVGYSERASGMVLPGGLFATMQGLQLARARHFPRWDREGPTAVTDPPLVYTSDAAHFSVARTACTLGLGQQGVVILPSLGRGSMDCAALKARIAADRGRGRHPFAVVATAGTTGTGAIDDLGTIADICAEHDLWLHVDACYGGGVLLLEELRSRLAGIERADSVAIDPHKWFFVPIVAAVFLTRHAELERSTFSIDSSYIPATGTVDPLAKGIASSRRCSGLTLWVALRAHGLDAVRVAIRGNIELCRRLEQRLLERSFVLLGGGELSVVCARAEPEGVDDLDELQVAIARHVVRSGRAWFATVRHQDRTWLRLNLVNIHTRDHHIDTLADLVAAARDEVLSA
jgi:aromatic-L-amino-acid decarboxylase